MTSRELVYETLEFRNYHNRAPRDLWTLPIAKICDGENFERIIRKYNWDIQGTPTVYHQHSKVTKGDPFEIGEYIDEWGCIFSNVQRGLFGEVKNPIVPAEDENWSDTSRIVIPEHLLSFDIDEVNKTCADYDKFLLAECCPRPFEQLQFIRGTENLYVDLILQPGGFIDFIDKMHEFYCRLITKWAQTDVDAIRFMDDWGSQRSLLINPSLWREIFKPMYRDYINIAHKYGKKAFMHSDGYILDIIPDLIELGLDAVNSQIFCMGVENLAQFRGKITFWGEMDRQHILPHGTKEETAQAVKKVYDTLWDNGGCIAQCEYGPCKGENVEALYDAWDSITSNR